MLRGGEGEVLGGQGGVADFPGGEVIAEMGLPGGGLRLAEGAAALGALTPKLEQLFVIKKRDIQPILDYNEKEMKLDAQLVLTITIGRAICLALRALVRFLKLWLNKKKAVSNT